MHASDKATDNANHTITSYVFDAGPGNEPRFEDRKLNILLDSYLDQVIDAEIYRKKKNEIFDRKLELQEEIGKIQAAGSSRLELLFN